MMVNMRDWVLLSLDESMGTRVLQEMEELVGMQRPTASMYGLTVICMSGVLRWPLELQEAKDHPKLRAK
jgi:hypothetical protein|tara:strand:+ start:227 stop:433 length:207 start_codon:yes stop_codon:yes gene_type:complete